MTVDFSRLLGKYRSRGILLDSNLLVLLFVGRLNPDLVPDFKRTRNQGFTQNEFSLLDGIVQRHCRVITTPHILAETSNYICQLNNGVRESALMIIAEAVQSFKERRPESKKLVQLGAFLDFGLTDCAILNIPPRKYLVLSVDAALIIALQKKGVDAINFNHLRRLRWES